MEVFQNLNLLAGDFDKLSHRDSRLFIRAMTQLDAPVAELVEATGVVIELVEATGFVAELVEVIGFIVEPVEATGVVAAIFEVIK